MRDDEMNNEKALNAAGRILMFADGACKGNPGGRGGWGVLIQQGAASRELYGGVADTTNNRMELTAVIEGLAALPPGSEVHIVTDSQYVQKGISEWIHGWKRRGWRTASGDPVKNQDLWVRLDAEAGRHRTSWEWVRGHNGHPENERADALANMGADSI